MQQDSTAKYIVQQYVAATGGVAALNSLENMYAIGRVRICGSEMRQGEIDEEVEARGKPEVGGFVLWQKNPDMWCLELVVSGYKVSAGCDGKVSWNHNSSQPFHAIKAPARPLRRIFQVICNILCINFIIFLIILISYHITCYYLLLGTGPKVCGKLVPRCRMCGREHH